MPLPSVMTTLFLQTWSMIEVDVNDQERSEIVRR